MQQENLADCIRDLLEAVLKTRLPKTAITENVIFETVRMLETLSPREAECLCRRYGITEQAKPLAEIGRLIGQVKDASRPVGNQMVGQLVRRALRKMSNPLRSSPILKAIERNGRI